MQKYLILGLLSLVYTMTFAQFNEGLLSIKLHPTQVSSNYQSRKAFDKYLADNLNSSYNLVSTSSFQVRSKINAKNTHLIEGMDVKVVGKPILLISITDTNSKKDTLFEYKTDIVVKRKNDVGPTVLRMFINDDNAMNDLKSIIASFLETLNEDYCNEQFERARSLKKNNRFEDAIRLLTNLVCIGSCHEKAVTLRTTVLKEHAEFTCHEKLHKAEIMINSGVLFQLKRATRILLSISPKAPCAQDALLLSKKIGESNNMNESAMNDILEYQNFHSQNIGIWESYYIQNLFD